MIAKTLEDYRNHRTKEVAAELDLPADSFGIYSDSIDDPLALLAIVGVQAGEGDYSHQIGINISVLNDLGDVNNVWLSEEDLDEFIEVLQHKRAQIDRELNARVTTSISEVASRYKE